MKFLEYTPLSRLNSFFTNVNVGDYVVRGDLEAYSCKLAGGDKKLSRSLESEVVGDMAHSASPGAYSVSPVGPMTDSASRKTLIYLILTLNHMYPDYDFSALRAQHFTKELSVGSAKNDIDSLLMEVARVWQNTVAANGGAPLLEVLWSAIDEVIALCDCDVYTYRAQLEGDPFTEEGNLWSFTVFFYNKKLKRILCYSCHATSRSANEQDDDMGSDMELQDGDGDYEEDFADGMDM